jgi:hypothetical protein
MKTSTPWAKAEGLARHFVSVIKRRLNVGWEEMALKCFWFDKPGFAFKSVGALFSIRCVRKSVQGINLANQ